MAQRRKSPIPGIGYSRWQSFTHMTRISLLTAEINDLQTKIDLLNLCIKTEDQNNKKKEKNG